MAFIEQNRVVCCQKKDFGNVTQMIIKVEIRLCLLKCKLGFEHDRRYGPLGSERRCFKALEWEGSTKWIWKCSLTYHCKNMTISFHLPGGVSFFFNDLHILSFHFMPLMKLITLEKLQNIKSIFKTSLSKNKEIFPEIPI